MDLIQETIVQHGKNSPHKGKINKPTLSAELDNPMCGDSLKIDIKIAGDQVVDICFDGEGCLISQASASLLIDEIKKVKDLDKIKKFNKDTVLNLLGIQPTLSRLQCAMLSLETLKKALA